MKHVDTKLTVAQALAMRALKIITVGTSENLIVLQLTGGYEIVLDRREQEWLSEELSRAFRQLHGVML